jgi:hypothetical protein
VARHQVHPRQHHRNARFFFSALGLQAIGFAPFGIDYTGAVNFPLGAQKVNEETLMPFSMNYRLVGLMMREIALLNLNGNFKPLRVWNGDQTDWGLNFTSALQVLRMTLGT